MELKHTATREGRLSSFLREEMGISAGLMNRLKWKEMLFVNILGCELFLFYRTKEKNKVKL